MAKAKMIGIISPPGVGPERAQHNREASEGPTPGGRLDREGGSAALADPEVLEKATRRRFSSEYKLQVLSEADQCRRDGSQIGELLRREGLYSSHLNHWRKQREQGTLAGLTPRKRGPKPVVSPPLAQENQRLQRENNRLSGRLKQAELIIEIQKKVSEILGIPLKTLEIGENV